MTLHRRTAAAALLACVLAIPAAAQDNPLGETLYDAVTGDELLEFVVSQGQTATLATDEVGDPFIVAETADGVTFTISTYDCEQRGDLRACKVLNYRAVFDAAGMTELQVLRAANQWNAGRIYGRAYRNAEGNAEMDLVFSFWRGASARSLENAHEDWLAAISEFEAELAN